jgi:signal transduction histidine kinase
MTYVHAELAKLAQGLLESQDSERERIARILHDDLGQQVASLIILTSTLKRRLSPQEKETCEQVDRVRAKLVLLAESMRTLSHELYPALLEHAGVAIAVRQFLEEFSAKTGMRFSFEWSGEFQSVPQRVGLCFYRIVEDVLQALSSRGDGPPITVRLVRRPAGVDLSVVDPGAPTACSRSDSAEADLRLAFDVIRQRVRSVSGGLHINRSPCAGMRLNVHVALHTWAESSSA